MCWRPWGFLQSRLRQWPILSLHFTFSNTWGAKIPFQLPLDWKHCCLHLFDLFSNNHVVYISTDLLFLSPKEVEELWPRSVFLCTQIPGLLFMICQKLYKWPKSNLFPVKSAGSLSIQVSTDSSVVLSQLWFLSLLSLLRGTILDTQVSSCSLHGQCPQPRPTVHYHHKTLPAVHLQLPPIRDTKLFSNAELFTPHQEEIRSAIFKIRILLKKMLCSFEKQPCHVRDPSNAPFSPVQTPWQMCWMPACFRARHFPSLLAPDWLLRPKILQAVFICQIGECISSGGEERRRRSWLCCWPK